MGVSQYLNTIYRIERPPASPFYVYTPHLARTCWQQLVRKMARIANGSLYAPLIFSLISLARALRLLK